MRIIATEPSITATVQALDATEHLVAVSRHCHRLIPEVTSLPRVDSTWAVTPEQLLPHKPDLVITAPPYREGQIEALLKADLRVLALKPTDLASIRQETHLLGQLVGKEEKARDLLSRLDNALSPPVLKGERVYIEIWPRPFMTGPIWVYDIINALGGTAIAEPNTQLTDETIIGANPDMILVAWAGVEKLSTDPIYERNGWNATTAIRDRRVAVVNEILLNAPGLNLIEGIAELKRVFAGLMAR